MARPPRVYKTPAIVLRQRKLGEADKIVTLYSANHGKLDAVAKGVRRIKSRLAGHVEPLNHGSYLLAHGRNLDIITQAQTIESFQPLRDDLRRLSHALYAAELVDRATEERSENFGLYRLLLDTMRRLSERDDLDLVLRFFEMSLLIRLGYQPQVTQCVTCGRGLAEEGSSWVPSAGGVVCPRCRPEEVSLRALSVRALTALRMLQTEDFGEAARTRIDPGAGEEVQRLLRDAVYYALDRDIRSAAFLDAVRLPAPTRPARIRGAGSPSRTQV